jgi:hypothetical protein
MSDTEQLYVYRWKNLLSRERLRGRVCKVLARGARNSCMVRFVDTGEVQTISRNALRKVVSNERQ